MQYSYNVEILRALKSKSLCRCFWNAPPPSPREIINGQRKFDAKTVFVFITAPADGLAPVSARPSVIMA